MLRPFQPEDCGAAADLIRRAFAATSVALHPLPSALGVAASDLAAHLAAGGGGVFAPPARACLLWACRDGALHLSRLAVSPDDRRRGLAKAMLEQAELEARRRNLPRMTLATRLALEGNRRLFARAGFVEGTLHSHPGFTEPTYVDMERSLDNDLTTLSKVGLTC